MTNILVVAMMGLLLSASAQANDDKAGPTIELPPTSESPEIQEGQRRYTQAELDFLYNDLTRGLQNYRFAIAAKTALGGYAELVYSNQLQGPNNSKGGKANVRRVVLFIAHNFTDDLRFYSEFEIENALTGTNNGISLPGYGGFEQAYIDYDLVKGGALSLRAGLLLVPMGVVNQWHEPTIFHGVDRPAVERMIIPSTWRELGAGIMGTPHGAFTGLKYELYFTTGFNPLLFNADRGLGGGRQQGALATANGFGITGRLEYEPVLGTVAGLSGYYGHSGANANNIYDINHSKLKLDVPITGVSGDFRSRRWGFEWRAVGAAFWIGDTDKLRGAFDAQGNSVGPDVGSVIYGGYGEVAYDVLHFAEVRPQLLPFVRIEHYDTMAHISGREKTTADNAHAISDFVAGLTFRPITQVVLKTDMVWRRPKSGQSQQIFNLGLGLMF